MKLHYCSLLPIVVQGRDHRVRALTGSNEALICNNGKSRPGTTMGSNEKLAITRSKHVVIVIFGSNNVVRKPSTTTFTRLVGRGSAAKVEVMVINCSK